MDLGRIGDRTFALVAGAGFDAAVMTAATRPMKERWGFAAYVFAAVKEALAAQPVRFRVTVDDEEPIEVDAVTVLIKPGYEWGWHQPGQYLRIGVIVNGVHHWRAYSLTTDPGRPDGLIGITPKLVDSGKVSPYLVRQARPGAAFPVMKGKAPDVFISNAFCHNLILTPATPLRKISSGTRTALIKREVCYWF